MQELGERRTAWISGRSSFKHLLFLVIDTDLHGYLCNSPLVLREQEPISVHTKS